MPRQSAALNGRGSLTLPLVRLYLRNTEVRDGDAILADAFRSSEPGAVELVALVLNLRVNPRTRRTMATLGREWYRLRRAGNAVPHPRWFDTVVSTVLGLYRLMRTYACPHITRPVCTTLQERLRRSTRRELAYTGAVNANLPTLAERAGVAASEVLRAVTGQHVVLWVDNWYCERYGVNPGRPVLSVDVTALAVLPLSSTDEGPTRGTRSHRLRDFPGHSTLHGMTVRVDTVAADAEDALGALLRVVGDLLRFPLDHTVIRVPLDVRRPQRRSLQWRALSLTENRLSTNSEMLYVLLDVVRLQSMAERDLLLLVDEKVHYAVMRLLYSQPFARYDTVAWLRRVPLLYGVWHAYKQTLHLVHRKFFPVLGLLEMTGSPALGSTVRCQRKVLYLEKICACLLLLAAETLPRVDAALLRGTSPQARRNATQSHPVGGGG